MGPKEEWAMTRSQSALCSSSPCRDTRISPIDHFHKRVGRQLLAKVTNKTGFKTRHQRRGKLIFKSQRQRSNQCTWELKDKLTTPRLRAYKPWPHKPLSRAKHSIQTETDTIPSQRATTTLWFIVRRWLKHSSLRESRSLTKNSKLSTRTLSRESLWAKQGNCTFLRA